jgi:alpha-1,2-mannosyltransferase
VFVLAPHQWLTRSGGVELTWSPTDQVIGSTYVWFTVLLFAAARIGLARRSDTSPDIPDRPDDRTDEPAPGTLP